MDGFNKVISFVLGLIVVVVIIAIITGRLNLTSRFLAGVSRGQTTTPTPTKTPTPTPTISGSPTPTPTIYFTTGNSTGTKNIPKTGTETYLLVTSAVSLLAGFIIKKKS